MEKMLYVIIPLGLFFLLDLIIFINTYRGEIKNLGRTMFLQLEMVVLIQQGISVILYMVDLGGLSISRFLLYSLYVISLTTLTLASFIWFGYLVTVIDLEKYKKHPLKLVYAIPVIIMFILCVISIKTGWVFKIDETGKYIKGSHSELQLFLPGVYVITSISLFIRQIRIKKYEKAKIVFRNFIAFSCPVFLGALIQLTVTRGGYTQIGLSMGLIVMYLEQYIIETNELRRIKSVSTLNDKLRILGERENVQLKLVNTLSQDFLNVYIIHVETKNLTVLKLDGYVTEGLSKDGAPVYPYDATCLKYINDRVFADDVEMMKAVMKLDNIESVLNEKREYVGTYRVLDKEEIHYYQYKYVRIADSKDIIAGFQNVDAVIVSEKEQREKLQAALESAKRANAAKSDFLARMSHDIRTPLNGIMGMIEINEMHPEDMALNATNREKAKIAAKHLLSLISDVLDLSKLESGKITLAHEAFDIRKLAADVINMVDVKCNELGLTLKYKDYYEAYEYPYVFGSPLHVRQIAINILGNCIKYNKPNGIVECESELVEVDDKKVTYKTTFLDTGIGMSEEYMENLYEPFSQEDDGARSQFKGTGLGMTIVKNLVEYMGGRIEVESKKGIGTKFTVYMTFDLATKEDIEIEKTNDEISFDGMNILLVEDNELNMEIAKTILEETGACVTEAYNGMEALSLFEEKSFDVILMDIMMPVMDGYETTEKIRNMDREDAKTIPIIAVTANAFLEDQKKCIDIGMNGHISKPIEIPKLKQAIVNAVAK